MAYSDLTPPERNNLDDFTNDLRNWIEIQYRQGRRGNRLLNRYENNIGRILAKLGNEDSTPNRDGGRLTADPITRAEIDYLIKDVRLVIGNYARPDDSLRGAWRKASGDVNGSD